MKESNNTDNQKKKLKNVTNAIQNNIPKIQFNVKFEKNEDKKRNFSDMVFIFTICSILGFFIEVGYIYLVVGKLVNRGVLYAPMCCIYGFGAIILYFLFYNVKPTKINIPYTFLTASCVLGAFELLCGLGFKYLLGIEMWNYDGYFLEILNYTTVPIIIGWGILGTIYVFCIQPLLNKLISFIPKKIEKKLAIIIVCYLLTDFVFSVFNLVGNPEILYKMVNPAL